MKNNEVAFIKRLKELGYSQKQMCVIMNANKSTMSRIWNGQTYRGVQPEDYEFSQELENRKTVFDIIVECREIPGGGYLKDSDKAYIKLLKHCHVPYLDVKDLYYDLGSKDLRPTWLYDIGGITYRDFDSTLIGIDKQDFLRIIK